MGGHIIIIFLLIILMAFVSKKKGLIVSCIGLLWLFSLRTDEIKDTVNYITMYEDPLSRLDFSEIGYLMIGMWFKTLTNADFIVFYLTVVAFCLVMWYFITQKFLEKEAYFGFCFLLFICFNGFLYLGVVTRNALSEILLLIGVWFYIKSDSRKSRWGFIAFIVLGALIHRSAAVFLLLMPIIKLKLSDKTRLNFYFICVFIWLVVGAVVSQYVINLFQRIDYFSKLENFSIYEEKSPSLFSLQILSNVILSFMAIYVKPFIRAQYKYIYTCFLNINMAGFFVLVLLRPIPASYRFYNMFFFFNYILLYLMIFENSKIKTVSGRKIMALVVSLAYFAILIHSFDFLLLY